MKAFYLLIILLSTSYALEVEIIPLTSDNTINYTFSVMWWLSVALVPLMGAMSFFKR